MWRWARGLDLTQPPGPLIRWALLLALGLCCWAAGIPLVIRDWLGPIIIAGALILPDVAGFGIAGMRVDLKHAQHEIARLKLRIEMSQTQNLGGIHIHGPAERTYERALKIEIGEQAARSEDVTLIDTDPAQDLPS